MCWLLFELRYFIFKLSGNIQTLKPKRKLKPGKVIISHGIYSQIENNKYQRTRHFSGEITETIASFRFENWQKGEEFENNKNETILMNIEWKTKGLNNYTEVFNPCKSSALAYCSSLAGG